MYRVFLEVLDELSHVEEARRRADDGRLRRPAWDVLS